MAQKQRRGENGENQASQPGGLEADLLSRLSEQLQLTGEQKAKYDAIVADFHQKMEAFQGQIAQLREKVQAARQSQDQEAAMEEMKTFMETNVKPLREQGLADIKAILTPEQQVKMDELKAQFEQRRGPGAGGMRQGLMGVVEQLNLTPEQKQQVDAALAEMREKMQTGDKTPEARQAAIEDMQSKLQTILTAEQLQKLEELKAQRPAGPGKGPGKGPGTGAPAEPPAPPPAE